MESSKFQGFCGQIRAALAGVSRGSIVGFAALCAAVIVGLWAAPAVKADSKPVQFDYEERTGYPLAFEERIVPLVEAQQLVATAVRRVSIVSSPTQTDWQEISERLVADAPVGRDSVRVVRWFSDQPVFVKDGFALLPDPSQPDKAVNPNDFNVASDCDPNTGGLKANRCISLHRDHVQNRQVTALLLAARTIIVKGNNETGGLSLVTITENLRMDRDSHIDLSARPDKAPTFGVGARYAIYKDLIGSAGLDVDIDALASKNDGAPGAGNPWRFVAQSDSTPAVPDLQWQFDEARRQAPDYEWPRDPCPDIAKRACQEECTAETLKALTDRCYREREPRGLAGLPGGHWLGLTYRASTIRATSAGQAGGDGGHGIDHQEDTKCNPPPMKRTCGFIFPPCNDINDPADNQSCDVPTDSPPSPQDFCACGACEATKCNVNFEEDQPAGGGCVVACEVPPLARGYRGGQAGPGGRWGLIRISVVVRESGCEADFSEENLSDPRKLHLADERCLNDAADDGDPTAVDCNSELCSLNPNVTVCPVGNSPVEAGTGKRPASFGSLIEQIGKLHLGDLIAYNPILRLDPRILPSETRISLVGIDRERLAQVDYPPNSLVPTFGGLVKRPVWAAADSVLLPDALWRTRVTFSDTAGTLTLPSAEAERLLSRLLDSPVFSHDLAPGGASAADVLGFEGLNGWSSNVALELSSEQHSQGNAALSIPGGWVQLTSQALTSLGRAPSALSFDVQLPSPAINPWWAGDVSVMLDAPSVGVYGAWIGQRSLQGMSLGSFQHVALSIPSDVASRLSGSYSDLSIKLTVNTPSGSARYLLDNLAFDGVTGGESLPPTPEALTFSVSLPRGISLDQAALAASGDLRIDDGAKVLTDAGGFALVANTGAAQTNVGVEAQVGSVRSVAPVTLRDRARVNGDVVSSSNVTLDPDASVSGSRLESRDLSPFEQLSFVLQARPSQGSVLIERDAHSILQPGSYGALSVMPGAVLQLSAGTYYFDSFGVEPESRLVLDATDGPIVLVVRSQLFFRGKLEGAAPESVLIAFAGTQPIAIEASLGATLVAPNAAVRYATGSTAHAGAVFAKSIELDPRVTFELRPFAYWSLFGGTSAAQSRLGQMVAYVRSAVASANPGLLAQEALNPRAVLELARLAASHEFRDRVNDVVLRAGKGLSSDLARKLFPPHVDWYTKEGEPPRIRIGAGDLQDALTDGIDFSGDTVRRVLCGDTLSGAVFGKALEGQPGTPGTGGVSADARRCLGFQSSFDKACIRPRPASTKGKSCTREIYGTCPNAQCEDRLYFPQAGEACPLGYTLQPLPSVNIFGSEIPLQTCPGQVDTSPLGSPFPGPGGNVDCKTPDGDEGTHVLPTPPNANNPAPDQVHTWTYASWAVALNHLSGVELSRRVGRANTFYKRGDTLPAAARYLSTRSLLLANFHEFGNPQCAIFPQLCSTCPADPASLASGAARDLCGAVGDVNQKLRQLTASTNFYGYTQSYVPPASMRLFDATSSVDLVSLVQEELTRASTQTDRWLTYGNIANETFRNVNDARQRLDLETQALSDAVAAGGVLSLEVQASDQRIRDLAQQLFLVHEKIKALNQVKAKLNSPGGVIDIDLGSLVKVAVVAAATAYGGPAGGAAAALVWSGIEKGLSANDAADAAIQERGKTPSATVVSSNGCVQAVQDSKKLPDGNACWDKFTDKLVDGLAESDAVKGLVNEFMRAAGLGEPAAPDALKSMIVDNAITSLTIEAYRTAGDLGAVLQEGIISEEKYREAVRQITRVNSAKNTLDQVPATGFPAPEVQLALADLAFKSAAAAVDRAGEYYFLLRRGAERDIVPVDAVTGLSELTERERLSLASDIECAGVTAPSLDINFSTLACFDRRVDFLDQTAAGFRNGRSLDKLEVADATVPFAEWQLVEDEDGDEAYQFTLSVDLDKAQRGSRGSGGGQPRQRFYDATFFLETNNAQPAPVRMLIRRPTSSPDVYYIGKANAEPQFQVFDVARGADHAPENPLFELLRDRTQYSRFAFACNGLNEQSPLGGELDLCKLSNLDENSRAFLVNRSLIGNLDFSIKVSDLEGKQPRRFFAFIQYAYDTLN
jgi:hypothetical protein